ncbi:MAG: FliO/MopB family protein [Mycobacterium leprae]
MIAEAAPAATAAPSLTPATSGPGLLTFLLMSAVVIVLAFYTLRFWGGWQVRQSRGRKLRVLEAVAVGRDRQVVLVAVGKEVLVLGSSPQGLHLMHQVPEAEAADFLSQTPAPDEETPADGVGGLENSIRSSLGKMRSLLKKDSDEQRWRGL